MASRSYGPTSTFNTMKSLPALVVSLILAVLINGASAITTVLNPTEDTYIKGGSTAVYGSATTMQVKARKSPNVNISNERRGYLKFDVTGISLSSVTSATLKLYTGNVQSGGATVRVCVTDSNDSWTEADTNWLSGDVNDWFSVPAYDYDNCSNGLSFSDTADDITLDVTTEVSSYTGGTTLSFVLDGKPQLDRYMNFKTKESSSSPELTIVVSSGGPGPSPSDVPSTSPSSSPSTSPTPSPVETPTSPSPSSSPSEVPSVSSSADPSAGPTPSPMVVPTPSTYPDPAVLNPIEDTYIRGGSTADYGDDSQMTIKARKNIFVDISNERIGYLKFDLSSIADPSSVSSATLTLYTGSIQSGGATVRVCVASENGWTEDNTSWLSGSTEDWFSYPNYDSANCNNSVFFADSVTSVTIDVTSEIAALASGTTTLTLVLDGKAQVDRFMNFKTKESSTPPTLDLSFPNGPTGTPSASPSSYPTITATPTVDPTLSPTDPPIVSDVPYTLSKFQPVLDNSYLDTDYPNVNDLTAFSADWFKLDSTTSQYMQFTADNAQTDRSELRISGEFDSSISTESFLRATVKVLPQTVDVDLVTFLQMHHKSYSAYVKGVPLRVIYVPEREGKIDWIWANIRRDLQPAGGTKDNDWIPLIPLPTNFFDIEISVVNSVINIVIEEDGVVTYPNPAYDFFSNYDFSYWDPMGERNFWKLGSYLGKDAVDNYPGIVQFDTVDYNVA